MRLVCAGLLLLATCLSHAQFGNDNRAGDPFANKQTAAFLPVEEAYQLAIDPVSDGLRLHWQIAEGYYLYQHQFHFKLRDREGEVAVQADFPPALERNDEFFGDTRVYYSEAEIFLEPARKPGEATLTVRSQGCADAGLCYPPRSQTFRIDFASARVTTVAAQADSGAAAPSRAADDSSRAPLTRVLLMLALAFAGGSLLNLMPCVFPVLSLKILGFADANPRQRHRQSWVYAAGVVSSFIAVAGLLIALQQAGHAIGWGFQLQSPAFVIALAYLFLAMGLALSGVIELGSGLMNAGAGLTERSGDRGNFFTGVLAVVVASPCTAPMMGTALGFAVTQPAITSLAIFAALGAGMAAPLVLLSYSGLARRLMPRPGSWMVTLKEFLAFPLYASAIWLLWVVGRQAGVDTMAAALLGGLFLALALWLWQSTWWRRAAAVGCLAVAVGLALWRPAGEAGSPGPAYGTAWSPAAMAELRGSGRAVFVDVTADWCITCIANERAVLYTDEIQAAFEAAGVTYMVADWTNYNPEIADFLRQHGRNGIPLYVLYPASSAPPLILPQLLRKQTVLDALASLQQRAPEFAATSPGGDHAARSD